MRQVAHALFQPRLKTAGRASKSYGRLALP